MCKVLTDFKEWTAQKKIHFYVSAFLLQDVRMIGDFIKKMQFT